MSLLEVSLYNNMFFKSITALNFSILFSLWEMQLEYAPVTFYIYWTLCYLEDAFTETDLQASQGNRVRKSRWPLVVDQVQVQREQIREYTADWWVSFKLAKSLILEIQFKNIIIVLTVDCPLTTLNRRVLSTEITTPVIWMNRPPPVFKEHSWMKTSLNWNT